MSDLIERLEAATEGSRELDCRVWHAAAGKGQPLKEIGPPTYKKTRFFCNPNPKVEWIGYDLLRIAEPYTTSLDAALSIVPEGWAFAKLGLAWAMGWDTEPPNMLVCELGGPVEGEHGIGHTPALALCIAALKARKEDK